MATAAEPSLIDRLKQSFRELDRVLRGEATSMPALRTGAFQPQLGAMAAVIVLLAMVYGICMGCYALFLDVGVPADHLKQLFASTVKVPALFLLTLVVTFPSLYVFNALVGSRLDLVALARLLATSLGVNLAVLASLGPIVAFFSVTTLSKGYSFVVLMNVVVFTISGLLGLMFLLQTLHRLTILQWMAPLTPPATKSTAEAIDESTPVLAEVVPEPTPSPLDSIEGQMLGRHVKTVFACWIILFGIVGGQMSWLLRPFIGNPHKPFTFFRERGSNFFEAVWHSLVSLFF